ncbi:MAG: GldG family protein [Myxococcota bacterium]|nr:GldG family protein [Myxococcota bacterium]
MTGLASLLGGLGAVFLGFGLVQLLIWMFQPLTDPAWLWGHLLFGTVLLLAAAGMSLDDLRERMQSGEGRRAGRYGTSALLSAALGLAILAGVAFLSEQDQYSTRFDWTEDHVHSLSEQTRQVLSSLEQDVDVLLLSDVFEEASFRPLLERYAHASERVKLEFADPNTRPDLVEAYGLQDTDLRRGLIRVAYGAASVEVTDFDESGVTNAIVKLTRGGGKQVCFSEGHNERVVLGEGAAEARGFARAATALRNETYEVETVLLAQTGSVPEDCDALVIAGATRPLLDIEHEALARYLEGGGALLVLLDPRSNTDVAADLESWGVEVGQDVVLDRSLALFGRVTSPFAADYASDHPITRDFAEPSLFHMARSLRPGEQANDFVSLVWTGDASWAETDLTTWTEQGTAAYDEDADALGPISLAVAGTPNLGASGEREREPRLVVFGDSDFATNELIDGFLNRDLFVNSVAWLLGEAEHISVRPNTARASRFQLSGEQFARMRMLSLFVLPEAIAILGVFTWWTRRSTGG